MLMREASGRLRKERPEDTQGGPTLGRQEKGIESERERERERERKREERERKERSIEEGKRSVSA